MYIDECKSMPVLHAVSHPTNVYQIHNIKREQTSWKLSFSGVYYNLTISDQYEWLNTLHPPLSSKLTIHSSPFILVQRSSALSVGIVLNSFRLVRNDGFTYVRRCSRAIWQWNHTKASSLSRIWNWGLSNYFHRKCRSLKKDLVFASFQWFKFSPCCIDTHQSCWLWSEVKQPWKNDETLTVSELCYSRQW